MARAPAPRLPIAALVAALTLVAPAMAFAQWTPPVSIDAQTLPFTPGIAFSANGRGLVAWEFDTPPVFEDRDVRLYARSRAGAYRLAARLPGPAFGERVGLAAYGQSRAVLLRALPADRRRSGAGDIRLAVSFGRTSGEFGRSRVLDRYMRAPADAAIAATPGGRIAVAYVERRRDRDVLRLALRRPGRGFDRPRAIRTRGRIRQLALDYGAGSDLVVAYRRDSRLETRVQRAGHSMGRVTDLGRVEPETLLDVSVARTGRTVVAWQSSGGDRRSLVPSVVRAAVRPAGPRHFRRPQVLDPHASYVPGGLAADTAQDGTATVAWTGRDRFGARPTPVLAATTDGRGFFTAPEQLDDSGVAGDVVVGANGTALVVWSQRSQAGAGAEPEDRILGALQPPGGRFGSPEAISPPETARAPVIGLDPSRNQPTVAWLGEVPEAEITDPNRSPRTRLRAATRR